MIVIDEFQNCDLISEFITMFSDDTINCCCCQKVHSNLELYEQMTRAMMQVLLEVILVGCMPFFEFLVLDSDTFE